MDRFMATIGFEPFDVKQTFDVQHLDAIDHDGDINFDATPFLCVLLSIKLEAGKPIQFLF